jgi:hypothetical protein
MYMVTVQGRYTIIWISIFIYIVHSYLVVHIITISYKIYICQYVRETVRVRALWHRTREREDSNKEVREKEEREKRSPLTLFF